MQGLGGSPSQREPLLILTHVLPRSFEIAEKLKNSGFEVGVLGLQVLEQQSSHVEVAKKLLDSWTSHSAICFTSPNAVQCLARVAKQFNKPMTPLSLAGPRVFAVGSGTAQTLTELFPELSALVSAAAGDAESLLPMLLQNLKWGERIAIIRGETGRSDWIEALERQGLHTVVFALYRINEPEFVSLPTHQIIDWISGPQTTGREPVWIIASTGLAGRFSRLMSQLSNSHLDRVRAQLCLGIHPKIVDRMHTLGFRNVVQIGPNLPSDQIRACFAAFEADRLRLNG